MKKRPFSAAPSSDPLGGQAQSYQDVIDIIRRETSKESPNLQVQFYPDRYMQAKITINTGAQSLLQAPPVVLIDVLRSENFYPESIPCQPENCTDGPEVQQYTLLNQELDGLEGSFVMKAAFGPSFISFWFRGESNSPRLDLSIFSALEILKRLSSKIDNLVESNRLHNNIDTTEGNASTGS